jgi:ATP-dependent exoDNAse (exonuclease V) beta subunit
LRYIADPENRIAKAQLATAYQNEVLCKNLDLNTLLLGDLDNYLPPAFIKEQHVLQLMPLYELLEKLFSIFQLSLLKEQDAYLFAFYDQVNDYLQKHSSELTAFISYWDEKLCHKPIPSGEIEGIRILSIHKSKGLEFHTVLLPFCDWNLENERTSYIWCSPQEAPFNELQLLPINYGTNMNESIYHDDYLKEKLQLWVDNLNLLYVAFTRPKNNLIVWCKDGHKNSVSQLLAEAIVGTSCVKQTIDNEGESDKPEDYIYQLGTVSPSIKNKNNSNTTNKLMIQPEG